MGKVLNILIGIILLIVIIFLLSVFLFPVLIWHGLEYKNIEMEPNGKAEYSTKVVHGDKLEGYISSNVLIKVEIYNKGKLIYDEKDCEHHFGTDHFNPQLNGGDLNITVTNSQPERVGVDYHLKVGHNTISLSPVISPISPLEEEWSNESEYNEPVESNESEYGYIELKPSGGKAEGSAKAVRGDKLEGYISSDVLIKVEIYNKGKLIYHKKDYEHHFKGTDHLAILQLKGGDLNITVTNFQLESAGVAYDLKVGHNTIFLSPV